MMEQKQLQCILEGALLAAASPLTLKRLSELFLEDELSDVALPTKEELLAALEGIAESCEGRGFELKEVASGWRLQVREEIATWVNRLWEEKPQKYSRALLETLSLIAYRQPITRGDIEEIRGVAVSSNIIRTLVEREWVKVVGHRDVPGRPSLYATTRDFLDYFNIKSLDELPTLSDIKDLDEMNAVLDLQVEEKIQSNENDVIDAQEGDVDVSAETSGATEENAIDEIVNEEDATTDEDVVEETGETEIDATLDSAEERDDNAIEQTADTEGENVDSEQGDSNLDANDLNVTSSNSDEIDENTSESKD